MSGVLEDVVFASAVREVNASAVTAGTRGRTYVTDMRIPTRVPFAAHLQSLWRENMQEQHAQSFADAEAAHAQVPTRLLTVFDVADLVGCHPESVRRAYLCGQLKRQRFGVRS